RIARAERRRLQSTFAVVSVVAIAVLIAGFLGFSKVQSSRQATAWGLLNDAAQMLHGSRAGGDVRALQELLAASSISKEATGAAAAVAESTRNQVKIIENPPRTDTTRDGKPIDGIAPVRSVAVSPDGTLIAWACDDRLVRVWNQTTNETRDLKTFGNFGS